MRADGSKRFGKIQFPLMKSRWNVLGCWRYIITFSLLLSLPRVCKQNSELHSKNERANIKERRLINDEDHETM